jgi:hypothetical protein
MRAGERGDLRSGLEGRLEAVGSVKEVDNACHFESIERSNLSRIAHTLGNSALDTRQLKLLRNKAHPNAARLAIYPLLSPGPISILQTPPPEPGMLSGQPL